MEWQGYLAIMWGRWRIVALVTLAAVGAALVYLLTQAPLYTARSSAYVAVSVGTTPGELGRSFDYAQAVTRSYAQVGTQALVLDRVVQRLPFATSTGQLAEQVLVQAPLDSTIVDIAVQDPSPRRAAEIANAVAEEFTRPNLLGTQSSRLPLTVSVLERADPPPTPSSPHIRLTLAIALVVGLLLGCAVAVARDALDLRLRTDRDISRVTGLPVIGSVLAPAGRSWLSRLPRLRRGRLTPARPGQQQVDARLRVNFQQLRRQRVVRAVAFASAAADGATSTTVSSLAVGLGRLGLNVVVVDADVRNPTLARRHDVVDGPGLTNVLVDEIPVLDAVTRSPRDPVSVLPAGPAPNDPSLLMQVAPLRAAVDRLGRHFDVVLIKAPPVLTAAAGLVACGVSDGVVVVTDEAAMNQELLTEELRMFEVAGAPVLGVVAHA